MASMEWLVLLAT